MSSKFATGATKSLNTLNQAISSTSTQSKLILQSRHISLTSEYKCSLNGDFYRTTNIKNFNTTNPGTTSPISFFSTMSSSNSASFSSSSSSSLSMTERLFFSSHRTNNNSSLVTSVSSVFGHQINHKPQNSITLKRTLSTLAPAQYSSSSFSSSFPSSSSSSSNIITPTSVPLEKAITSSAATQSTTMKTGGPNTMTTNHLEQMPKSSNTSSSTPAPHSDLFAAQQINRVRGLEFEKMMHSSWENRLSNWKLFCSQFQSQSNPYSLEDDVLIKSSTQIATLLSSNEWRIGHEMGQNFDALVAAAKQHYLHLTGSEWSAETKNAYDSSLVATAVLNVLKERFICNLGMENVFELNSHFVNDVLKTQKGIPLTVAIIFMTVMKRFEIDCFCFGKPSTFLVGFSNLSSSSLSSLPKEQIYSKMTGFVDISTGKILSQEQFLSNSEPLFLTNLTSNKNDSSVTSSSTNPSNSNTAPLETMKIFEALLWKLFLCSENSNLSSNQVVQILDYLLVILHQHVKQTTDKLASLTKSTVSAVPEAPASSPSPSPSPSEAPASPETQALLNLNNFYKTHICVLTYSKAKVYMKLMKSSYQESHGNSSGTKYVGARINLQPNPISVLIQSGNPLASSAVSSLSPAASLFKKEFGIVPEYNLFYGLKAMSALEDAWEFSETKLKLKLNIQDLYSQCYTISKYEKSRRIKGLMGGVKLMN